MPGFYHQPIRRRDFLKASCVAGAAVVFQGCQTLPGTSSTENEIHLALLSDTHMWSISERQGVKLINLPALGYNFSADQPVGWVNARFRRGGVDLTMHAIAGNRTLDGQTSRIVWT